MRVVVHAPQAARVDVAVDLRRRERRVAEQLLDRAQVGAALEQVGRVRVPEAVRVRQQPAEDARVEPPPADRDEQRVARAARERRPPVAQPEADAARPPPRRAGRAAPCRPCPRTCTCSRSRSTSPRSSATTSARAEPARVDELEQRRVAEGERVVAAPRPRRRPARPRRAWASPAADGRVGARAPRPGRGRPERVGGRATAPPRAGVRSSAGARPRRARPSSAVYSASARTSTSSSSEALAARATPRSRADRTRRRAGSTRRGRAREEPVDRDGCVHVYRFSPASSTPAHAPPALTPRARGRGRRRGVSLVVRRDDERRPTTRARVTLVGDSLNVGIEPYLREELPGLAASTRTTASDGRRTEGIDELESWEATSPPSSSSASARTTPTDPRRQFRGARRPRRSSSSGPTAASSGRRSSATGRRERASTTCFADARGATPNVRLVDWAAMVAEQPGCSPGS